MLEALSRYDYRLVRYKNFGGSFPNEILISEDLGPETITNVANNLGVTEPPLGRQATSDDLWHSNNYLTHGTNSSALPGMAREGGLKPGGTLMKDPNAIPPFTGEKGYIYGDMELPGGFVHTNVDSISTVPSGKRVINPNSGDIEYETKYKGWSPEKGRAFITKWAGESAEDSTIEMTPKNRRFLDESHRRVIALEERRLAAYEKLSAEEQALVSDPYPIVVRINDYDPSLVGNVISSVRGDIPYGGESLFGREVDALFVPADKVDSTLDYLAKNGVNNVRVFTLESLEDYRIVSSYGLLPPMTRP